MKRTAACVIVETLDQISHLTKFVDELRNDCRGLDHVHVFALPTLVTKVLEVNVGPVTPITKPRISIPNGVDWLADSAGTTRPDVLAIIRMHCRRIPITKIERGLSYVGAGYDAVYLGRPVPKAVIVEPTHCMIMPTRHPGSDVDVYALVDTVYICTTHSLTPTRKRVVPVEMFEALDSRRPMQRRLLDMLDKQSWG